MKIIKERKRAWHATYSSDYSENIFFGLLRKHILRITQNMPLQFRAGEILDSLFHHSELSAVGNDTEERKK